MANLVRLDGREYQTYDSPQDVERRYANLKQYFNRTWTEYGHGCEIRVRHSELDNGQPYFYLMGYVDGVVPQHAGSLVADSSHYHHIKHFISWHVHSLEQAASV